MNWYNATSLTPDKTIFSIISFSANNTLPVNRKMPKNKAKKWPGVGCAIKCMNDCNTFKECKKNCKTSKKYMYFRYYIYCITQFY